MTVKMGQFQRYTGNLNIETLLSIVEVIVYIDGNCDNRFVHTKLYTTQIYRASHHLNTCLVRIDINLIVEKYIWQESTKQKRRP